MNLTWVSGTGSLLRCLNLCISHCIESLVARCAIQGTGDVFNIAYFKWDLEASVINGFFLQLAFHLAINLIARMLT